MKKMFFLLIALCFTLSACTSLTTLQPQATSPAPSSETDLQTSVAISVEQTLQALPSPTLAPSNIPVVMTDTSTPKQATPTPIPTETQDMLLLTLTATLGTGTVASGTTAAIALTATPTVGASNTSTVTPNPASPTPTETLHPQHYGTMPPNLPFGQIMLINKSKAEVYISLQCTTKDGYTTIIEYPVGRQIEINAPAGKYVYVAWVGGNKIIGKFGLDKSQGLTLTIYKDRIEIK